MTTIDKQNWPASLLNFLLNEMIEAEKEHLKDSVTYCLCSYSLQGMNPNEIDSSKTFIKTEDDRRYYFGITTKKGVDLIVPLDKRHIRNKKILRVFS